MSCLIRYLFVLQVLIASSLFSREKLLFLHVPKTGGVTLAYLLEKHFSYEETCGESPLLIAYGFHHTLYEMQDRSADYKLITFLRDPIERVLSEHRYCMEKWQGRKEVLEGHFLPPDQDPIYSASNITCKILSGLDPNDPQISVEEHLEAAKFNLATRFFFVGITEKFTDSIERLFAALKWPPNDELPMFNATRDQNFYSEEIIELIAAQNWADIKLYQFALSLYREREEKSIFEETAVELSLTPTIGNSSRLIYDMNQPMDGTGWGRRETLPNGTTYRWVSSQNRASLFFHLNPVNYLLDFRVLVPRAFTKNFSLVVNGNPVYFKISKSESGGKGFAWMNGRAKIPAHLISSEKKTEITFSMTPPEDPSQCELLNNFPLADIGESNFDRGKCAVRHLCFTEEKNFIIPTR